MAKSNYNGMYLSSLEDTISDGYAKLVKANKKAIPHYKILEDQSVRAAVIQSGKVWFFRDNVGNNYVYGFYQGVKPDASDNSPLKIILDSGAGLNWKNAIAARDRDTGSGWIERSANNITNWQIGSTELGKKLGLDPKLNWYAAMQYIEAKNIKHNDTILLIIKDVRVVSLQTIARSIPFLKEIITVALQVLAMAIPGLGLVAQNAIKYITGYIASALQGKPLNITDVRKFAESIAPVLADAAGLGDVTKEINDLKNSEYYKSIEKGVGVYNSYNKNRNISDTLGYCELGGLADWSEALDTVQKAVDAFSKGDVKGIAKELGIDEKYAEKAKQGYDFINNAENLGKLDTNVIDAANSMELPEVQNWLINTYSSLLERNGDNAKATTVAIPNSIAAVKLVTNGYILEAEETKNLINVFQGEYANAMYSEKLAINAICEEAKSYANTDTVYFLPSNVPPKIQVAAGKRILKEQNVKVDSTNSQVALALNFDREFI